MHKFLLFSASLLCSATGLAASLDVDIELPQMQVADYRRPYVAVWLEHPDHRVAANLAVWYDLKMAKEEGRQWLKDLRLWWRRSGRELDLPVDGLTSATRRPGTHRLSFSADTSALSELAAGEYQLFIEAAREHGGREVLSLPLHWPPQTSTRSEVRGEHELGRIGLTLTP